MHHFVEDFKPRAIKGYEPDSSSRLQTNSPLQEYIDRQPKFRIDEISELFKKVQAGDPDARGMLVDKALKLIRHSVRSLNYGIKGDEDELINIACEGILENIESVDLTKTNAVSAIHYRAQWAVLRSKDLLPRKMSVPFNVMPELRTMQQAESELEADSIHSEDADFAELLLQRMESLKPEPSGRIDRLSLIKTGRAILDSTPIEAGSNPELEAQILPGELSDLNQMLDDVESAVSASQDFGRMAGPSRFQVGTTKWEKWYTVVEFRAAGFTLQAIANAMGVTRERVRQMETDFYRLMIRYRYADLYPGHLAFSETREKAMERRQRLITEK